MHITERGDTGRNRQTGYLCEVTYAGYSCFLLCATLSDLGMRSKSIMFKCMLNSGEFIVATRRCTIVTHTHTHTHTQQSELVLPYSRKFSLVQIVIYLAKKST